MKINLKRFLSTLLIVVMIFSLVVSSPLTASTETITMVFTIDKNIYTINDVSTPMDVNPVVIEERTMLPVRFVAEPLGAAVEWDENTQKVTIRLMDTKLELWIGQSNAIVNGATVAIDPANTNVKPLLLNDRTMLPLRFVTENLGCEVTWNDATQQATITKSAIELNEDYSDEANEADNSSSIELDDTDETDESNPDEPELTGEDKPDEPEEIDDSDAKDQYSDTIEDKISIDYAIIELKPRLKISDFISGILFKPGSSDQSADDKTVTNSNKAGIKTLLDIGRGYDIFGRYGTSLSLKNAVLNTDKLIADGQIQRSVLNTSDFGELEGESLEKYSKSMTTKAKVSGGYMGFSASVSTSFSSSYTSKSTSYYDTIMYLICTDNLFLKASCDYKKYLNDDIKQLLNTGKLNGTSWTAAKIFDAYGSHVLVDGIFGGRLEYSVVANSLHCMSYKNFKANVKAGFNAGFASITGELEHDTAEGTEQYNSNKSTTIKTYGGLAQDGVSISGDKAGTSPLQQWRDSVADRPVLVEFGTTGAQALIPIWEMCSNAARAAELETAFKEYANGKQVQLPPPQEYITGIDFVVGSSQAGALAQIDQKFPGWIPINVNLNDAVKNCNTYIYLVYKKGTDVNYALTDLFMEYRSNAASATLTNKSNNGNVGQYFRHGRDLNQGAKGDYVYLWSIPFRLLTQKQPSAMPITEITVHNNGRGKAWPTPGDGWTWVKWQNTQNMANCNRGTDKGSDIFIKYKTVIGS